MTERPILFSALMVRALLAGAKTQTRRALKRQPPAETVVVGTFHHPDPRPHFYALVPNADKTSILKNEISEWEPLPCPYGQPGDRLWVRESLRFVKVGENLHEHAVYAADGVRVPRCPDLVEWCCDGLAFGLAKSVPSIHMPRWASRITLEITGVRVERLQDINGIDAIAEGLVDLGIEGARWHWDSSAKIGHFAPWRAYRALWDEINGPLSWVSNPWVWAVAFKRI